MRVGVMGLHYGHIGSMFSSAVEAKNSELVGIVEPDEALFRQYASEAKIPRFRTLDEMLEKARPELVMEGLDHNEKTPFVETCARAGTHVLLDKPLCRTMDEWNRIETAVQDSDIKLSMFYTSRYHPPFIALREAVLAGELGEIVSLISTHPHKLGDWAPAWYFDPLVYTGTFADLAGHGVDQVRWLTGAEYVGVHAMGSTLRKHTGIKRFQTDHVQASYQMSNGACAVLTADWLTPEESPSFGDTRFILMGTKGSAHLRAYAADSLLIVSDGKGAYEPTLPSGGTGAFVQEMVEALSRGEEHLITTQDVLQVARASIMAEESVRQEGAFLKIE
jgi:predicted dehydrogenase